MTEEQVPFLVEKKEGYAILTLNRREQKNALSSALLRAFQGALEETKYDCKVLILTGAGDSAFCAGLDLKEAAVQHPRRQFAGEVGGREVGGLFFQTLELMRRHPAIFIAAVNGYALGGGLALTHNSELAIASERAQFGMPEMSFGAFSGLAGPATTKRLLPKHAAWMILTAGRVDAQTALRYGIVNEVVAPEQLLPRAEELAKRIAAFDAVALDYGKKAIQDIATLDWSRSIEYGLNLGSIVRRQSAAAQAGIDKFAAGGRAAGQGADAK